MLVLTLLLLGALPQSGESAKLVAKVSPVSVRAIAETSAAANDSGAARDLPSMPKPKMNSDAGGADATESAADASAASSSSASSSAAGAASTSPRISANSAVEPAIVAQPLKVRYTRPRETRTQRVAWYALTAVSSGAAAFDAYSTRLAVSGNYGTETNPFLRPFAHSNALYAVTQVSPAVLDYIGKRMMTSETRWVRKLWWLPQVAGSGFSVTAGVHNLGVVK
jgi:hypothetical protein